MIDFLKKERFTLLLYSLLFGICISTILISDKASIHLSINNLHSPFFDQFFKKTTILGEGLFAIAVAIIFLLISFKHAIAHFLAFSISGILAQFFKKVIFTHSPRPKLFFESITELRFVEGVSMATQHSFPSGHTTTAFAIFITMAFMVQSKLLKSIFLFCAVLVGYSRMYLSQHFLIDITFGSLLGTTCAIITYYQLNKSNNPKLNQSLLDHINKLRKTKKPTI